jgi:hypothetical protein
VLGECVVKINEIWGRKSTTLDPSIQGSWQDIIKDLPDRINPADEPSEFEKEWKVVDKDLGIVKYGSEKFQRDETTGQWISFKTGKPVPQRFVPPLDRALPPTRKTRPQDIPGAWWGQRSRPKV